QRYIARSEINQRRNNEDSFQIFSLMRDPDSLPITILAIADGMGGCANGKELSWETLRKFSVSLFEEVSEPAIDSFCCDREWDMEKILLEAVDRTNVHLRRRIKANGWKGGGSTIVAVAIWDNTAVGVNLGDSPLYHYQNQSQNLTQITQNHNVSDLLLLAGAIDAETASIHHRRN
ncbi:PP2C family protein-serine/threonine phosphatase, partial [Anaplasma marginale]|uniref:PP2C family protein-serine/threonine phosphatase n=1 Tax=Anaplasma marginale TaxID=770 RepID=UPI0005B30386